jgi:hypothetical protein
MERKLGESQSERVTINASRAFAGTFVVMAQLWFSSASGYIGIAVLTGVMTLAFHISAPWGIAAAGGFAWVAIMLPILFAYQAWKTIQLSRKGGPLQFELDAEGLVCNNRSFTTQIKWPAIVRVRTTKRTIFFYISKNAAWFIDRRDLKSGDEQVIAELAAAHGFAMKREAHTV